MRTLQQVIDSLPADERAEVAGRGQELIAEEMALRHLRKARQLTQENMAKLLGVGQESISKIEGRSDMLLSTLRSYVEAMGGSLKVVAEFPDGRAIITSLPDAMGDGTAPPNRRTRVRAPTKRKAAR